MKSHALNRFVPPPPAPKPTCCAPGCTLSPDVVVPLGEGVINLCWLCAHQHVDHNVSLSECATSERCEHTPDEIYPWRLVLRPTVITDDLPDESQFVAIEGRMVQYRFDNAKIPRRPDPARSAAISRGMRLARKSRG